MKERILWITIKDKQNREFKITFRDSMKSSSLPHQHCNITMNTKLGDVAFWHASDFNMTKREGIVIQAEETVWDYTKAIGHRSISNYPHYWNTL